MRPLRGTIGADVRAILAELLHLRRLRSQRRMERAAEIAAIKTLIRMCIRAQPNDTDPYYCGFHHGLLHSLKQELAVLEAKLR